MNTPLTISVRPPTPHDEREVETDFKGALMALNELREDTRLSKNRHFAAADRKERLDSRLGVAQIILSAFTGTVLIALVSANKGSAWVAIATLLSFAAAALGGLLHNLKLAKQVEGHKRAGNLYQDIGRQSKMLAHRINDGGVSQNDAWKLIDYIRIEYNKANEQAESLHTTEKDFEKAKSRRSLTASGLVTTELADLNKTVS